MKKNAILILAGLGLLLGCTTPKEQKVKEAFRFEPDTTFEGHVFPDLPYAYNALEPYIDSVTMEIHYDRHHRNYYRNFLKSIEGSDLVKVRLEDIFKHISTLSPLVRNNGGGFYNHNLFWLNMAPSGQTSPSSGLLTAIERDFGSLEAFKEKFADAAKSHFGSGWAWLSLNKDKKLFISTTANQDNPLMDVVAEQGIPLLTIDVWEHAYYLKYQNKRTDYVDNFWNVINWEAVNERYNKAIE